MVGIESEKRRWLRAVTARPKLSISFALLIFLVLFGGAKISAQSPRATAVIEIRENPLYEQIAALDSDLVPGPIVIGHEAERLRSVDMVLAVLSRLPEEEFNEIAAGNGTPPPTWLVDRLVTLCSREDAIGAMARLLCAVLPAGDIHPSSTVATIREGLEMTADTEQGQILISLSAADPERAAAIVNLFADIYVQHLQLEKQRLRDQVADWITERRKIIESAVESEIHVDAADPTANVPPAGASGATSPPSYANPDRAIADQARAAREEFLRETTPLLTSTAWAEPAAVVRSTVSPPIWTGSLAGGVTALVLVPVSLILGFALGALVDIVWPAGERRPSFYDNPYWPLWGDDVSSSPGRIMNDAGPERQLIATAESIARSKPSPAIGRRIGTRQEQKASTDLLDIFGQP